MINQTATLRRLLAEAFIHLPSLMTRWAAA
jgi:hypothetical protein